MSLDEKLPGNYSRSGRGEYLSQTGDTFHHYNGHPDENSNLKHFRTLMPKSLTRNLLEMSMACGDNYKMMRYNYCKMITSKKYDELNPHPANYDAAVKDVDYITWIVKEVENDIEDKISKEIEVRVSEIQSDKESMEIRIRKLSAEISMLKQIIMNNNTFINFIVILLGLLIIMFKNQ